MKKLRKLHTKREDPILVVDASCICHIMKNRLNDLAYHHVKTGILFGFLRTIEGLFTEFGTNKFVFVWDSPINLRKKLYSGYKGNRKKEDLTSEEKEEQRLIYEQFNNIRDTILPELGFKNVVMQKGYEADDLLHEIVANNKGNFVMVTTDHDMFQSLDHCKIVHPTSREVYTKGTLFKEHGVTPRQWADIKALGGCTTDNVPGVKGVGIKKAASYLLGNLNKGVIYERIVSTEGKAIRERNEELVILPFKGTAHVELDWNETFKFSSFIRVCEAYGLVSFLKKGTLDKWKDNFRMV